MSTTVLGTDYKFTAAKGIFNFFSETAELNLTTLDRKYDPNVLYQLCVFFQADRKTKIAERPLISWGIFDFTSEPLKWIQRNLTGSQISMSSTKFMFIGWSKTKMAALASNWLQHFRLLFLNCWIEFNETYQEARSQRPLPSFTQCFSGWSRNQDEHPGRSVNKGGTLYSGARYVALWAYCLCIY